MVTSLGDVGRAVPGDVSRFVRQQAVLRRESLMEGPPALLLAMARVWRPVLTVGRVTLVTRHADVVDVLSDAVTFSVSPYAPAMVELAGPFALGQDGPDHATARERLAAALAPIDGPDFRTWAVDTAEQLVAERAQDGHLDVVTDLAERVAARFAAVHLGVPGPDEKTLVEWSHRVFDGIFLNLDRQRSKAAEAAAAAEDMRAHVDALMRRAGATTEHGGTVLHRLVAGASDSTQVRTDLIGLVVGSVVPLSESIARTVDDLLSRPQARAQTRAAAQRGDDEMVWRHARESLRLAPASPGVVRRATADADLGKPARASGRVTAGGLVLASTTAAMGDPTVVTDPGRFIADRPDSAYLHFGAGPHRCLGEPPARVLVTAAVSAVLRYPGLRRAAGREGRLAVDGRRPTRLVVTI